MYNASLLIKAEGSPSLMFSVVQVLCLHSAGLFFQLPAQLFLVRINPYYLRLLLLFNLLPLLRWLPGEWRWQSCGRSLSSVRVGQVVLSLVLGSQCAPVERCQDLYIVFLNISKEQEWAFTQRRYRLSSLYLSIRILVSGSFTSTKGTWAQQ